MESELAKKDVIKTMVRNHLAERQARNPSYSLRSLAKKFELSPALLSQILAGQRSLTLRSARKILKGLDVSPIEEQSILREFHKSKEVGSRDQQTNIQELDRFQMIADWYHYAILSLVQIKEHKAQASWIAQRIGITEMEANQAIERLIRLGYIEQQGNQFIRISNDLDTTQDIPSGAIRKYHRQNIDKALNSLELDPIDKRYFGSLTMAINEEELPRFKMVLRKLKNQIRKSNTHENPDRVYQFNIQFFPIDKEKDL